MAKLVAVIPEDGWAIVRDEDRLIFVRPPFLTNEAIAVSETMLSDAITRQGFERVDSEDESWSLVVGRIKDLMVKAAGLPAASDEELLTQGFALIGESSLRRILDKIEHEWIPGAALAKVERALDALFRERRIQESAELRNRVWNLRQQLERRRQEKLRGVAKTVHPRIARASERVDVQLYKVHLRAGSVMVGAPM